jgi:hypothetical protein
MPPKLMRQKTPSLPKSPTRKRVRSASPNKSPNKSPKRSRKNLHPNLTANNLENLHTVNLNAPEWRIHIGNNKSKETIPAALRYLGPKAPAPLKSFGKLPSFLSASKK